MVGKRGWVRQIGAGLGLWMTLAFSGCYPEPFQRDNPGDPGGSAFVDQDQDGFGETVDCNDVDASIFPGATELCNGRDENCDSVIDDGLPEESFYVDLDGDGFGGGASVSHCGAPLENEVREGDDCDDDDDEVSPKATESCNEVDDDCDGRIDEGVQTTYYRDSDDDGYGDASDSEEACTAPDGYLEEEGDCDDDDAERHPGVFEQCDGVDNDCDGNLDEGYTQSFFYPDEDGDGFGETEGALLSCFKPEGYVAIGGDCDDADASRNPGEEEVCDGVDNDCDLIVDDGLPIITSFRDQDGDGFGTSDATTTGCSVPDGYVVLPGDCDDASDTVAPNMPELCDALDNDCDGIVDEGLPAQIYFPDADGDGYGDSAGAVASCAKPADYVLDGGDCDDSSDATHPGALEQCDFVDNDCDGATDEGIVYQTYYPDLDGDGYGQSEASKIDCVTVPPYVLVGDDCDDENSANNPGAVEVCDGEDNDCDGNIDEDIAFFPDGDGDGFGDPAGEQITCDPLEGWVSNGDDCDDTEPTAFPGALEVCDGQDNDCDGKTDEGFTESTYYPDEDGDGVGVSEGAVDRCEMPLGYAAVDGDCDDTSDQVYPGALERCDGLDNDCDGAIENYDIYFLDSDQDGYGDDALTLEACESVEGYVRRGGDCDEEDPAIHPGAKEVLDGKDNDCNGLIDDAISLTSTADRVVTGSDELACGSGIQAQGYGLDLRVAEIDGVPGEDVLVQIGTTAGNGFCLWTAGALEQASGQASASFLVGELDQVYSAAVGWFNGDGYVDLAISGQADSSAVYVFLGSEAGFHGAYSSLDANGVLAQNSALERFGEALLPIDLNDDGIDELLVSAPGAYDGAGAVRLFGLEKSVSDDAQLAERLEVVGEDVDDRLGTAMVAVEEPAAVWVSAPEGAENRGLVYEISRDALVSEVTTVSIASIATLRLVPEDEAVSQLGLRMASIGDVDDDGIGDLLIAGNTQGGEGIVYLLSGERPSIGTSSIESATVAFRGSPGERIIGTDLAAVGDLNGDGIDDFAFSGTVITANGLEAEVFMVVGRSGGFDEATFPGVVTSSFRGPTLVFSSQVSLAAADLEGDAHRVLLVGIPGYSADESTWEGLVAVIAALEE